MTTNETVSGAPPPGWTPALVRRAVLILLGVPIGVFALVFILSIIIDAIAPDQLYATSIGLSLRECEQVTTILATPGRVPSEAAALARELCYSRVPKKP
jgi:hypothetical protein